MPFALVFHHAHVSVKELDRLRQCLPYAIARALSVPGTEAALEPTEIEVKMFPFGSFDAAQGYEVAILIFANDYPERRLKLDESKHQLMRDVEGCFEPGTPICIFPFLGQGFFVESGVRRLPLGIQP